MINSLPDVKKSLKAMHSVNKVTIDIQEFGEGFDTHVNAYYRDKWLNEEFDCWQVGEEEKLAKAEIRAKRIKESLEKQGYYVEYEGLANC